MMSYINETDFVIENKELVYPEIITDGLQLYYDAKGKRDTDYHRDTMLDMSGNGNHGQLHNFAYQKHSGYKDGLVFDYIDDKLTMPKLNGIDVNSFTYQLNNNILAFTGDEVKTVKDGNIEVGGRNLFTDSDKGFNSRWGSWDDAQIENTIGTVGDKDTNIVSINKTANGARNAIHRPYSQFEVGKEYTLSLWARLSDSAEREDGYLQLYINGYINRTVTKEWGLVQITQKVTATNHTIHIAMGDPDWTVDVALFKLEKGNTATDWTPAPEDLIGATELKGNILGDMENIVDGLYKTEVLSGEEIYTDESDDSVVHVEVEGKSYQGSNVLTMDRMGAHAPYNTPPTYNASTDTLTFTYVNQNQNSLIAVYERITFKPGRRYIVSGYAYVNGTPLVWSNSKLNTQNPDSNVHSFYSDSQTGYFEADETYTDSTSWLLHTRVGGAISGDIITISNFKAIPVEPRPDMPQEIHSLNDFDVVSSVGKRNLVINGDFEKGKGDWVSNGSSEVRYGSEIGKYYLDTLPNSGSTVGVYRTIRLETGKTYNISFLAKSPDGSSLVRIGPDNRRASVSISGKWERYSFDYKSRSSDSNAFTVYGANINITDIQVNEGEESPWSPHLSEIIESDSHPLIDKINLSLDEPLRSVGDIKDRLFRDSDGLWKIERKVGEHIITKLLRKNSTANTSDYLYNYYEVPNFSYRTDNLIASHVPTVVSAPIWANVGIQGNNTYSVLYINIGSSPLADNTVAGMNNWLSNNPITIQYELEAPTIETLNQELQDKLNNLRSFEDSNYVYSLLPNEDSSLSNKLKPTLHAKFLYNNWYKEDRVINNLMIYNRALTNEEMLQNYKTIKRRWGM